MEVTPLTVNLCILGLLVNFLDAFTNQNQKIKRIKQKIDRIIEMMTSRLGSLLRDEQFLKIYLSGIKSKL